MSPISDADMIARLPIWSGQPDMQPLAGGLTNRNFVVTDTARKVVVRLGGDIAVHGIVRTNEVAASRAAYAAGIAPHVVHAEPGVLAIAFIEGRTFTAEDVRDPRQLGRLVELTKRCHREMPKHLRGSPAMFWVFHVLRDYTHTLKDGASRHQNKLPDLLARAEHLEAAVGPIDIVFGHNDLLAANIIDDGKRLWLVDWEYAGFNSPLFDLGGLASNSQMSNEAQSALLEAYFDRPIDDHLRRRAAAMTAASLLRESLWSMVCEIHSPLAFDFAAYTAENLTRFEAAYAAFVALETVGAIG